MENTIRFYKTNEPYGYMSNFSRHQFSSVNHEGRRVFWKTSEHYFQAMKYIGTKRCIEIMQASTPSEAARLGRDRSIPLRSDWEMVKEDVMRAALMLKFYHNVEIRDKLIETGDAHLIESTINDNYWGDGGDGSGKNRLGFLLEEVRDFYSLHRDNIDTINMKISELQKKFIKL